MTTIHLFFRLSTVLIAIFSITGLFGTHNVYFDIFSHFRLQYAFLLLLCIAFFSIKKLKPWIVTSLVLLVFNVYYVLPYLQPAELDQQKGDIKIVMANVWSQNKCYDAVRKLLNKEQPDVIVIEELTPIWEEELAYLRAQYPFHIAKSENSNFGIGLWSKYPFKNGSIKYLGNSDVPTITGVLKKDSKEINFIATHPVPPASSQQFDMRLSQFKALQKEIQKNDSPVLLIGDLNAVPSSPIYEILTDSTTLRDAANGFGFSITWPTFFLPLALRLDNCLVSEDINVTSYQIGNGIGSDHLPIIIEISL